MELGALPINKSHPLAPRLWPGPSITGGHTPGRYQI